jgi:hypothetical protein
MHRGDTYALAIGGCQCTRTTVACVEIAVTPDDWEGHHLEVMLVFCNLFEINTGNNFWWIFENTTL